MKFRKSIPTEPTVEERLALASAKAGAAQSIFVQAASDLEQAADEHDSVMEELEAESVRLSELADHAFDQSCQSRDAAARLRTIFA